MLRCCRPLEAEGRGKGDFPGEGEASPQRKRAKQHSGGGGTFTSDASLAEELNNLSVQERDNLYAELHGVAENSLKQETDEFIEQKLAELRGALAAVPQKHRKTFDRASFLRPTLLSENKFLLLFLRADQYDAKLAAKRVCSHFNDKLELWGEERLAKHITLDDFTEGDLYSLRGGGLRILPATDRSGRLIKLIQPGRFRYNDWKEHCRMFLYQMMSRYMEDHDLHANGIVGVINMVGITHEVMSRTAELTKNGVHTADNSPTRILGQHICYDNPTVRIGLAFFIRMIEKNHRLHMRFHYGSLLEAQYTVLTFGIRVNSIHFVDDDVIQERLMDEYIADQRRKEAILQRDEDEQIAQGRIPYPTPQDVLLGRGKGYFEFSGNHTLTKLIEEHTTHYIDATDKMTKTALTTMIVTKVRDDGGRFLERKEGHWAAVNVKVALRKVSQVFRLKVRERNKEHSALSRSAEE